MRGRRDKTTETGEIEPLIVHDSDSGDNEGGDQQEKNGGEPSESMMVENGIKVTMIVDVEEDTEKELDVVFDWKSSEEELEVETVEAIYKELIKISCQVLQAKNLHLHILVKRQM